VGVVTVTVFGATGASGSGLNVRTRVCVPPVCGLSWIADADSDHEGDGERRGEDEGTQLRPPARRAARAGDARHAGHGE
jgi:hypothetical protein